MTAHDPAARLREALRARNCIPFCGAGISAAAGLPTVNQLLKDCGIHQLQWSVAIHEIKTKHPDTYKRFLQHIRDARKPHEVHRYLAGLDARFYITTNFDSLLEAAIVELHGEMIDTRLRIVKSARDVRGLFDVQSCCIKLHGDIHDDEETLVLTSVDYHRRLREPTHIDKLVELLLLLLRGISSFLF